MFRNLAGSSQIPLWVRIILKHNRASHSPARRPPSRSGEEIRDECLKREFFYSLKKTQVIIRA
jgi:hypothetical protein